MVVDLPPEMKLTKMSPCLSFVQLATKPLTKELICEEAILMYLRLKVLQNAKKNALTIFTASFSHMPPKHFTKRNTGE